jgi:hypothetical protein
MSKYDTLVKQVPEGTIIGTEGAYPYLDQVGKIVSASVSGSLTIRTPSHGPASEIVVIYLDAWKDAGGVITFPYAFAQVPAIVGNTTGIAAPTVLAASVNFGNTSGAAKSGYLVLIGNSA